MNRSIKRKQYKIFLKNISTRTPSTIIHMPHDFISFYLGAILIRSVQVSSQVEENERKRGSPKTRCNRTCVMMIR